MPSNPSPNRNPILPTPDPISSPNPIARSLSLSLARTVLGRFQLPSFAHFAKELNSFGFSHVPELVGNASGDLALPEP